MAYCIGVDEVGTGAWAGPAAVAAVLADPAKMASLKVRDSKQLSRSSRSKLVERIVDAAFFHTVVYMPVESINEGLKPAWRSAVLECLRQVHEVAIAYSPVVGLPTVIIDGSFDDEVQKSALGIGLKVAFKHKADATEPVVSAASILAKVDRDRLMAEELHNRYPVYGFDAHSGYGTVEHMKALDIWGKCPVHRQYRPLAIFHKSEIYT